MIRVYMGIVKYLQVIILLGLTVSAVIPDVGYAETVRRSAGGDDAMRKAQYLLRQLSQEKEALQTEKEQLQGELGALTSKVSTLENSMEKQRIALGKSSDKNSRLVDRINRDHEHILALQEKYRNTVAVLEASSRDNELLINAVQERNQWIDTCRARNDKLYEANVELLGLYENKGLAEALGQRDPVTQIGAVKVENEVQNYRFRLEDLRMSQFVADQDRSALSRQDR